MSRIKELLGKRIKDLRLSRGLTQEQLAEATNIGAPSISKIESGVYHPSDKHLEQIAMALKVKPYQLYMFDYMEDASKLRQELGMMLSSATDEEIRSIYKLVSSVLN